MVTSQEIKQEKQKKQQNLTVSLTWWYVTDHVTEEQIKKV